MNDQLAHLQAENERLQAALEEKHEAVRALLGFLRHGWCDSIASAGEPDCACGLRGRIDAALAMPPDAEAAPDDR